jgi:acetyl-CoA/propionyl-CoA carboxylase biotin carboxyl carrier protein
VEARVYAEDPARGFLPTGGRILALREPASEPTAGPRAVRVDSGVAEGGVVGSEFDPMLAKVIAWAPGREEALRLLDRAMAETVLLGVTTNIPFLRGLLTHPAVRAGHLDTGLVERILPDVVPAAEAPGEVLAAAALAFHAVPQGADPWEVTDGWRVGEPAWTTWRLETRDGVHAVQVRGLPHRAAEVRLLGDAAASGVAATDPALTGGPAGPPVPARIRQDGPRLTVTLAGRTTHYLQARHGDTLWLGGDGAAWAVTRHLIGDPGDRPGAAGAADGVVRSPMPGTVLVVKAQTGDRVDEGQPLVIVEAMKMEHTVTAPVGGVVAELPVQAGQPVDMDAVLAVVAPAGAGDATGEEG